MNVKGLITVAAVSIAGIAHAAFFYTETFTTNPNWIDRDPGEMLVSHNTLFGNIPGSIQGTFASQTVPFPEIDAFRITSASSGGAFTGDYWTDVPGFTSWSFDFYAEDVLPSAAIIRFGDGLNTFQRSFVSSILSTLVWTPITIPLTYAGWFGGTATQFSNALSNVTFIDIEVSRSGLGAQDYFVDNFSLNGQSSGSAIPEPDSLMLFCLGAAAFGWMRRYARGWRGGATHATMIIAASFVAVHAGVLSAHAAGVYAEDFAGGLAGWTNREAGVLSLDGGAARISFAHLSFPAVERARITADASASGGQFCGDYVGAGIKLMGFDFTYEQVPPQGASVQVYVYGTGSLVFTRSVLLKQNGTGAPERVVLSLDSASSGGWIGTTEEDFAACLQSVTTLQFRIQRNGLTAQNYRLDNIFLAQAPVLAAVEYTDGAVTLTAESLMPGVTYTLRKAGAPDDTWTALTNITASAAGATFADDPPSTNPIAIYRLEAHREE